ncbi:hypothetical protein DH2020_006296 [Rehmannia glutinosa]|uniref:BED-type domain-containing protein n=1 Tax=Rehmannia glutinosa TaxID=99300 RepID=A0ABR0XIJ3_REHGL
MSKKVDSSPQKIVIEDEVNGDTQNAEIRGGEQDALKRKDRKRKSKVWSEFTVIKVDNGREKAKCNYCSTLIAINSQGSTTQFHRHLESCPVRLAANKSQRLLCTQPLGPTDFGGGSGGTITTYKYDKEKVRECLAKMVIVHEYPFRMLEHEFFVTFCKTLNPRFDKMSRVTLRSDCMKLYDVERNKLRVIFEGVERFSLTADLWTSNQNIGYLYWGIENKISTITLDNASSNDAAVRNLKDNFSINGKLYFGGRIFHVRCCAHVLNLMVQDGLHQIRSVIENIRESVKYLKMSPSRLHRFSEIVKQLQLPTSKGLILDVPTRWNSTYAMLESALVFRDVFPRYKERDPYYQWLPSLEDWDMALEVCKFLEAFSDATHIFSGVNYPTSNLFLPEVWKIRQILNEKSGNDNKVYVQKLALRMREKFDKYWGDCNLLMAMGAVFDPRYKMKLVEFCYSKIYPVSKAREEIELVLSSLHKLYVEYVANCASNSVKLNDVNSFVTNVDGGRTKGKSKGRTEFELWAQKLDTIVPNKSELDIYLEEGLYVCKDGVDTDFNALDWWKANTLKFRTLNNMARDILSIPITTVASESAFSAGGRVLDQYRSSLKPDTVQALVCTGDWLRSEWKIAKSIELDDEDVQKFSFE